jgi:hypothetical protein
MKDAALPVTLIVVGLLWLAWYFGWFRDVDWIISAGFVAGGIGVLATDRITKSSIVAGPLLIAMGVAWYVSHEYRVSWHLLIPLLLVLAGAMMLIARSPSIPERRGAKPRPESE